MMQSNDMELDNCLELLQKVQEFLIHFKADGFINSKIAASGLIEELEMRPDEAVFPSASSLRRRRVKRQSLDETEDESVHDPEERFRIEFFNVLMDQALMSLSERFEQFKGFQQNFGFLFKIPSLKHCRDDVLRKHCITLKDLLSGGSNEDSDIDELTELKALMHIVPEHNATPMDVLCYMRSNRLDEVFPNVTTALRILLTAPITVASAERSFSKLKLITEDFSSFNNVGR